MYTTGNSNVLPFIAAAYGVCTLLIFGYFAWLLWRHRQLTAAHAALESTSATVNRVQGETK